MIIRCAVEGDTNDISAVKRAVWPQEEINTEHIASVVRNPEHITLVAAHKGRVVGFVDGFMTIAADGLRRWEVDLLAVHPPYQGQGIGTQLVMAITEAGKTIGSVKSRALIGVSNTGSQRTFKGCEYIKTPEIQALYVASGIDQGVSVPHAHLIPVSTMNYIGVWVEGALTASDFAAARTLCGHRQWEVAGAVIPTRLKSSIQAAQETGYTLVGYYEWWFLDLYKP
jgi:GNAT superfamily N-acetyltransferase